MESDVPGRSRPRHCTRTFLSDKLARQFVEQYNVKRTLRLVGEVVPIAFEDVVREYLGSLGLIRKSTRNSYSYDFAVFDRGIARGVVVDDLTGQHIASQTRIAAYQHFRPA